MIDQPINAIKTPYNGHIFRSKLECRWALFFDWFSIEWKYEPQHFSLVDSIYYLPDFWLPKQECWFEVKGKIPTVNEQEKAARLAKRTGHDVILAWGNVGEYPEDSFWIYRGGTALYDDHYAWCNTGLSPQLYPRGKMNPEWDLRKNMGFDRGMDRLEILSHAYSRCNDKLQISPYDY